MLQDTLEIWRFYTPASFAAHVDHCRYRPDAAAMTRLLTAFALLLSIHALPATGATGPARAWVRFDIRHIISAGAQGAADHRQGRVAMTDDPVRMASISKLAVAIAVKIGRAHV